ncbi:PilZ domain-containing protein [Pseudoduganella sp. GCM10020061]|uniref:PilZ domain-containing protein n=1 Tax=Pseudoduganella sp. GCM10020061 TaxID=3317345 RepID=UPI00363621F6
MPSTTQAGGRPTDRVPAPQPTSAPRCRPAAYTGLHLVTGATALRERRAHTRALMHEHAFLLSPDGTGRTPVIMLDISLRGASFATPEVIESGALRRIEFGLPGSRTRHHILVKIVNQSTSGVPGGFRVGAMFVEVDPATTGEITDFVSKAVPAP